MNCTKGKYLLLGSNLGDRPYYLKTAVGLLQKNGVELVTYSSIYESEPWGINDQPLFLNAVLQIETKLSPDELLACCLKIEKEMGRKRIRKWGERLIDIDILYFDEVIIQDNELTIPHPGIPERRFTLLPLSEIAPKFIHPSLQKSQSELLDHCADPLNCHPISNQLDA